MNEVTKLYENAKIDYEERYNDCTLDMEGECHLNINCDLCNYSKEKYIYPPFTAEKQISLIKWLSDVSEYFSVHYDRYKGMYNVQTGDGGLYVTNNLSEAIASRVNIIWNDLSEKQHKQIKEILE